jgi:IS5 family transposase
MAWKNLTQMSLADGLLVEHEALHELDGINEMMDWSRIEKHLSSIYNKAEGNLAFPPLMMFKAMLLQSWYKLSDPALEKQLARDLLFRRFVGLSLSDNVPDHSTIWRFRQSLQRAQLQGILLGEINQQMKQRGLLIQKGSVSIIDASVIEAQRARPNKSKTGETTQDPEAAWNVKTAADGKRTSTYGYKAHVSVDEDGFVKATGYTAGNVHDSQQLKPLLDKEPEPSTAIYADSAYASQEHDKELEERGIINRILKRAYRNRPLNQHDKATNRLWSQTRSTVERVFGILKLHYGMAKARYVGLKRNAMRFDLMCMAYNMKRGYSFMPMTG